MIIKEQQEEQQPRLMIIPMIDIIFFLLVFFMLAMLGMVQQRSMPVNLPKAANSQAVSTENIPVTITANGDIYYEKEKVDLDTLVGVLEQAEKKGPISVILVGDNNVNYGKVVEVMDGIKKAGVEKVSIATDLRK